MKKTLWNTHFKNIFILFNSLLLSSLVMAKQVSVGKENKLVKLQCDVKHAYGMLGGYSMAPKSGDRVVLDLEKLTSNNEGEEIRFSKDVYIPHVKKYDMVSQKFYGNGKLSSQKFSSLYKDGDGWMLGINYAVAGEYDAKASISFESNIIHGVVFLDCNIIN